MKEGKMAQYTRYQLMNSNRLIVFIQQFISCRLMSSIKFGFSGI